MWQAGLTRKAPEKGREAKGRGRVKGRDSPVDRRAEARVVPDSLVRPEEALREGEALVAVPGVGLQA